MGLFKAEAHPYHAQTHVMEFMQVTKKKKKNKKNWRVIITNIT